jgi:membrane protein DedA with SNARE-associated domain
MRRLLLLFLLLALGGESILLPVLRVTMGDARNLLLVMGTAVAASVVSDLFWYYAGRYGSRVAWIKDSRFVNRIRERKWVPQEHFEAHWKELLLLSKFVYGTRTTAQVLCGASRRPVGHYLLVNTLGAALLVSYLCGLIALFKEGFVFASYWWNVVFSVVATALFSFVVGKGAWRRYSRRARLQ